MTMKGSNSMAKLALVENERDPARVALAAAIAHRDKLAASVAALNAAQSGVRDRLSDARVAVSDLADTLKATKAATALHLVNTSIGQAGAAPETMESVRRRIASAEDDLEIARDAETTLKGRLAEQQTSLSWAQDKVKSAALAGCGNSLLKTSET
jgi:chromosome segregation ATPase